MKGTRKEEGETGARWETEVRGEAERRARAAMGTEGRRRGLQRWAP